MSIYQPAAFAAPRDAALQLIHDFPFATLVTPGEGEPHISHLPLLFHANESQPDELIGHMARANSHWKSFGGGPTLALFHGPHAYVSPSWYLDSATAVPTWNYVVVHVHATAIIATHRSETLTTVNELTRRFEAGRPRPWTLQLSGERLDAMLAAIVAFRLVIERIDAKFKLSQNRDANDQRRVAAALADERYAEAGATSEWMRRYGIGA